MWLFLNFKIQTRRRKVILDSKDVDFSLYDEFLSSENRYLNLKRVNSLESETILEEQKQFAMKRFEYYKRLADVDLQNSDR